MRVDPVVMPSLNELNAQELSWGDVSEPVPATGLALVKDLAGLCVNAAGHRLTPYLLLDSWDENPLAALLQEEFPEAAKQRYAIPDPFYKGREGEAVCLVPMPQALRLGQDIESLSQAFARDWLAHWLQAAWQEVQARLVRQHFCGVLLSGQSIDLVAKHLARLGFQYPPVVAGQPLSAARLFRYQDPRVMQGVWPALAAPQRKRWLGPIHAWLSLQQAWGPWFFPDSDSSVIEQMPEPALWVQRLRSDEEQACAGEYAKAIEQLFAAEQWALAHLWPVAQRIWARYRLRRIPADLQPDGGSMSRLLSQGLQAGLNEQELTDFVWASWLIVKTDDQEAARAAAVDWQDSYCAGLLQQALRAYRQDPEQGLAKYFQEHQLALQQRIACNDMNKENL